MFRGDYKQSVMPKIKNTKRTGRARVAAAVALCGSARTQGKEGHSTGCTNAAYCMNNHRSSLIFM